MEFKTLQNVPVENIYRAFTDAFSNYEVKQEHTIQQFSEMIATRSFSPENSMGCFINDQLVGFILCGIRDYNHEKHVYIIATGVRNEHQKKNIGKAMLQKLIELLKSQLVKYFRGEVLVNNTPAINLYQSVGFEIVRRLECYEVEKEVFDFAKSRKLHFSNPIRKLAQLKTSEYQLYQATWQTDLVSIGNSIDKHSFRAIEKNGEIACYGFIHREIGQIPQIGIHPKWRHHGLETQLIAQLSLQTRCDKISFINIEANSYLSETFDKLGIEPNIFQYDLQLSL